MTDETKEREGIVKAKSSKNGFNSFCFTDDDKTWYSTKHVLEFEKGDKVKIAYTEQVNGQYTNRYVNKADVVEKAAVKSYGTADSFRDNVDLGNQISNAKDVLVALINQGKVQSDEVVQKLDSLVDEFIKQFKGKMISWKQ